MNMESAWFPHGGKLAQGCSGVFWAATVKPKKLSRVWQMWQCLGPTPYRKLRQLDQLALLKRPHVDQSIPIGLESNEVIASGCSARSEERHQDSPKVAAKRTQCLSQGGSSGSIPKCRIHWIHQTSNSIQKMIRHDDISRSVTWREGNLQCRFCRFFSIIRLDSKSYTREVSIEGGRGHTHVKLHQK